MAIEKTRKNGTFKADLNIATSGRERVGKLRKRAAIKYLPYQPKKNKSEHMPIFMDVHIIPGIKALDVAEAHRQDLLLQNEHSCKCMTYWIDEERESIFCLIEAPVKEAVVEMHNRAHGSIPSKIIEVSSGVVQSFLGRIYDPSDAEISDNGLKVFNDPSFRILLVTRMSDPILFRYKAGAEKADKLLEQQNKIIRENITKYEGSEAEHRGTGFIASFTSAAKAISCALAIQKNISTSGLDFPPFSIALNAGVPVGKTSKLFGDTIQFAGYLCAIAKKFQIAIACSVRELVSKDSSHITGNVFTLEPQDEHVLELLFCKLEENFQDPDFDITDYCQAVAMSKSQLYRKTIALTGLSPNLLLKEYRLEKAKELMNKKRDNISEITFDAGFTSPSYFTKCFKKKYGVLPMTYLDLLHQRVPL